MYHRCWCASGAGVKDFWTKAFASPRFEMIGQVHRNLLLAGMTSWPHTPLFDGALALATQPRRRINQSRQGTACCRQSGLNVRRLLLSATGI